MTYNKPSFEKVASFKNSTMGLCFGKWNDIFGGRAIIKIEIGF
ncbi:putative RiPP precursor [Ruminococcus flavefaciens]|nr:putative RiPP precursor [Ruminococcus flavefaciens]